MGDITVINNDCHIHTKSSIFIRNCRCKFIISESNNYDKKKGEFKLSTTTKAHLKFINLLENDFGTTSFENFVKYLCLYRTKPIRLVYAMKIVGTLVRFLKYYNKFDSQQCAPMLNKYGMVKYRYFEICLQEELKTMPTNRQIAYLELNSPRPLALDNDTVKKMFENCITFLEKQSLFVKQVGANKKYVADVLFHTLFILSLYTGARTIANLYRLTTGQYKKLLSVGEIDVFGKNNIKITIYLVDDIRKKYNDLLKLPLRIVGGEGGDVSDGINNDERYIFVDNCSIKQLDTRFDALYKRVCKVEKRPEWIKWHAARRWFLGEVFSKCGLKIASKAVSHKYLKTTARYVHASVHSKDIRHQLNKALGETR